MYASTIHDRVMETVDMLETFPKLGRMVPDYKDETVRELVIGTHRLIHGLDNEGVLVLAFIHGSRNILRRLGDDPWNIR